MPTEPESNIEEQLKAWAAKRRADANGEFELHPATRRVLQEEVARSFPTASKSPDAGRDWLAWLRPRVALALSVVAVMFVLGIMLLPAKHRSKSKQESVLALNERDETKALATPAEDQARVDQGARPQPSSRAIPTSAAASVPTTSAGQLSERSKADASGTKRPEPTSEVAQKSAVAETAKKTSIGKTKELALAKDQSGVAPGAAAGRNELPPETMSRYRYGLQPAQLDRARSADAKAKTQARADADKPATVAGNRAAGTPNTTEQIAVQAPIPAAFADRPTAGADQSIALNSPDARSLATKLQAGPGETARLQTSNAYAFLGLNTDQLTQRFAQAVKYRRNFNSPPMPNVLTTFQLEQNGQQLRIVDADGSVYEGEFLAASRAVEDRALKSETDAVEGRKNVAATPPTNQVSDGSANNGLAGAPTSVFRVAGMNRSLNQLVVFTGNLVAGTNNVSAGGIGGELQQTNAIALRQSVVQQQATSAPPSFPRLEGQALLGDRESLEINATAVGP